MYSNLTFSLPPFSQTLLVKPWPTILEPYEDLKMAAYIFARIRKVSVGLEIDNDFLIYIVYLSVYHLRLVHIHNSRPIRTSSNKLDCHDWNQRASTNNCHKYPSGHSEAQRVEHGREVERPDLLN